MTRKPDKSPFSAHRPGMVCLQCHPVDVHNLRERIKDLLRDPELDAFETLVAIEREVFVGPIDPEPERCPDRCCGIVGHPEAANVRNRS